MITKRHFRQPLAIPILHQGKKTGVFEVGSIALGDSLANRTGTLGAFRIEFGWKRAACNNQEQ
jgi:hypothetical protein